MPRWLHRFGPKKYELFEHVSALLIRSYCRLSYRRVKNLMDMFGIRCPSKSALQHTASILNSAFWQRVLLITASNPYLIAIDSTGLSRTNPSYHYLKRIDGKIPKIPVKLSASFDTRRKKFCSAIIRVLPAHDIKDAKHLITKNPPQVLVADKAYDSNQLHLQCKELNIKPHIPLRKYGKTKHKNMSQRNKAAKHFNLKTYHRRELIESAFSSLKRKLGSSVSSKNVRTIRTEIYGRLTCHNIFYILNRHSGQSRFKNQKLNFWCYHTFQEIASLVLLPQLTSS